VIAYQLVCFISHKHKHLSQLSPAECQHENQNLKVDDTPR